MNRFNLAVALYAMSSVLTFAIAYSGPFDWRFYCGCALAAVTVIKAKLSPGQEPATSPQGGEKDSNP
jgi:hypothetical protein